MRPGGGAILYSIATVGFLWCVLSSTPVVMAQPSFTMFPSPLTQVVQPLGTVSYVISVLGNGGFSGSVTLTVSSLPQGVAVAFSPNPVHEGKRSTMTVTAGPTTPLGDYAIRIAGKSGSLSETATVRLAVTRIVIDQAAVSDPRADVDSVQTVSFHASWAHNSSSVADGEVVVNSTSYFTNETGWAAFTESLPDVGALTWVPEAVKADGVTAFTITTDLPSIVWDRLKITSYRLSDTRADVGTTQTIRVTAEYEYDGKPFTSDEGNLHMNAIAMTYDPIDNYWQHNAKRTEVGRTIFRITRFTDGLHGLSAFADPIAPVAIVWDSVTFSLSAPNTYFDVGTEPPIQVTGHYDYDGAEFQGTVRYNDTIIKTQAGTYTFTVSSIHDTLYDLSRFNANSVDITYDRIIIVAAGPIGGRVDLATSQTVFFAAQYELDGKNFTDLEGVLFVNYAPASYSYVSRTWELRASSSAPSRMDYAVTRITDHIRGLSSFASLIPSPSVTWDRIRVVGFSTSRVTQRVTYYVPLPLGIITLNVSRTFKAEITASIIYEYDQQPLCDGWVFINDQKAQYSPTHETWTAKFSSFSPGQVEYRVTSIVDRKYGLTGFYDATGPVTVTWVRAPTFGSTYSLILLVIAVGLSAAFAKRSRRALHIQA